MDVNLNDVNMVVAYRRAGLRVFPKLLIYKDFHSRPFRSVSRELIFTLLCFIPADLFQR